MYLIIQLFAPLQCRWWPRGTPPTAPPPPTPPSRPARPSPPCRTRSVYFLIVYLFTICSFVYFSTKGPHGVAREGGVGRGQRAGRVARELLVVHRKQGTDRRDSEFMRCFFTFWVFLTFLSPFWSNKTEISIRISHWPN